MALQAINPATAEAFASYEELSAEEVRSIIADTHQVYLRWRATSFRERATLMRNAAGRRLPWRMHFNQLSEGHP